MDHPTSSPIVSSIRVFGHTLMCLLRWLVLLDDLALVMSLQYLHCAFSSVPLLGLGTVTLTKLDHTGEVNLVFLFFLVIETEHAGSWIGLDMGIITIYFYALTLTLMNKSRIFLI